MNNFSLDTNNLTIFYTRLAQQVQTMQLQTSQYHRDEQPTLLSLNIPLIPPTSSLS